MPNVVLARKCTVPSEVKSAGLIGSASGFGLDTDLPARRKQSDGTEGRVGDELLVHPQFLVLSFSLDICRFVSRRSSSPHSYLYVTDSDLFNCHFP